jgi:hypothetical protein
MALFQQGMRAFVRVTGPDGAHELGPGDIIGRLASAALVLNDPRVSEAHAMVSLRRGRLWLLSLRRRLFVDGCAVREVCLTPGLEVSLCPDMNLRVDAVETPAGVLALRGAGIVQRVLSPVTSVLPGTPPLVVARFVPGAAVLWSVGTTWRLQLPDEPCREVGDESHFFVGGHRLELATVTLAYASQPPTVGSGVVESLRLTRVGDEVTISSRHRTLKLTGLAAQLLGELMAVGGPVGWESLAQALWPSAQDEKSTLRRRFDAVLVRLRATLRAEAMRADLVTADGTGLLRLTLYEHDLVDAGDNDAAPA